MDCDDYLAILRLFEDEVVPDKQIQNQLPQQSDPESKQAQHPHLCPPRSIGPPESIEISTPHRCVLPTFCPIKLRYQF